MFTFEHRSADMLIECDVLSCYNTAIAAWLAPPIKTDVSEVAVSSATSTALAFLAQTLVAQLFEADDCKTTGMLFRSRSSQMANAKSTPQRVLLVTGAASIPIDRVLGLLRAEGTVIYFDSGVAFNIFRSPPPFEPNRILRHLAQRFSKYPSGLVRPVHTALPIDNGVTYH
jgi:hypothetical protein